MSGPQGRLYQDMHLALSQGSLRPSVPKGPITWVAVDEVGRGAIAGPLVVCATAWHLGITARPNPSWPVWLEGVRDSKKLTSTARHRLLMAHPWAQRWKSLWDQSRNVSTPQTLPPLVRPPVWEPLSLVPAMEPPKCQGSPHLEFLGAGLGVVEALEIDSWGLSRALGFATARALGSLGVQANSHNYLLCDGKAPFSLPAPLHMIPQKLAVGGDDIFASVGFSSIVAKVLRDHARDVEHEHSVLARVRKGHPARAEDGGGSSGGPA